MKQLFSSCVIAFSTYSRIPMPQVEWNEKNMRHTLAFFPLVGAAVGLIFWLVDVIGYQLGLGMVLRSALLTAVPVVVTGGIHLDGYCDTVDALASHASREKKLEILKDSSAGAFAVIWCAVWFLAYFGFMTEKGGNLTITVAAGFLLSRTLSALAIEQLPSARAGMGATLKSGSRFPWWVTALYVAVYLAVVLLMGAPVPGLVALVAAGVFFFLYKRMALKVFGGFTGDLAGWFLTVCELVILAAVILTEKVVTLWF